MKRGDISDNIEGHGASTESITPLIFNAQEPSAANRTALNILCKESPATGQQGSKLISQGETGKERGGAQSMGEDLRKPYQAWDRS